MPIASSAERDGCPERRAAGDAHERRPRAGGVRDHELTDDRAGDELVEVAEHEPCGSCIGGRCDHHMKLSARHAASIGQRPTRDHQPREERHEQVEVPLDREAPVHDVHLRREREAHVLVEREEQEQVARVVQHRARR